MFGKYFDKTTPPHISTLIIIAATGAIMLNIFVASLNEMADDFGVTYPMMQFAITGYLIATSVMQLFLGPISDRFGRRRTMIVTLVIFIVAAFAAAFTTNYYVFMALRVVQAVIVSSLIISRAIIRDVASRERAASLIGYVSMGMSLAPMFAPIIGGFLADIWGWRSNFVFASLAGIVTLIVVYFDQGETHEGGTMNLFGQFAEYPVLLRSRRFWGYMLVLAFATGAFFAYLTGAPFVGSEIYGLTGGQLGAYFIFAPFGFLIGTGLSGRYAQKLGIPKLMIAGLVVSIIGMSASLLVTEMGMASPLSFFAFTISIGLGNGLTIPTATAALLDIRPDIAGSAAGLSGAMVASIGAIIAQLTGNFLTVEAGIFPLVAVIVGTNVLGLIVGAMTLRRDGKM